MTADLILGLVGLTSAAAWILAVRGLGRSPTALRVALVSVVEGVGLAVAFLALNLVVGFVIVRAISSLTGHFVSVYALEDTTLFLLSGLQGFVFRWWLGRG